MRLGVQRAEHADRRHRRDEQEPVDDQVSEAQAALQLVFPTGPLGRRTGLGHRCLRQRIGLCLGTFPSASLNVSVSLPGDVVPTRSLTRRTRPYDGCHDCFRLAAVSCSPLPAGYCAGVDRAVIAGRESPGAVRRLRLRPARDRPQQVRRPDPGEEGRHLRRADGGGPRGNIVMFSAHGVAPGRPRGGRTRQSSPPSTPPPARHARCTRKPLRFRERRLRHPPDRPRGPRGGHRHLGEAPDHIQLVDGPEDVAKVEVRDLSKVVWPPRPPSPSTRPWRPSTRSRTSSRSSSPCRATTSATPRRTSARREADGRRGRALVIVVGSQLLQLQAPRRGRQAGRLPRGVPRRLRRRDRTARPGWMARHHGRRHLRRLRPGRAGRAGPGVAFPPQRGFEDVEIVKAAEEL